MSLNTQPGFTGCIGPIIDVTDLNGTAGKAVIPSVVLADATGVNYSLSSASRPVGATVVGATSGNIAAASAVAALPAVAAKTNYVEGFTITGAGATAASNVIATLAGLLGGTNSYIVSAPAGVTTQIQTVYVEFTSPRPASAINTAITLTLPSLGAGNTHACVNIWGFVV